MKTALLSFVAAVAMLATTQSFAAAPASDHRDNDRREKNYKEDRRAAAERARFEAARRKMQIERERKEAAERARQEARRRKDRDFNYGYDRNHRVTSSERARWEAAHRNDYGRY